MEPLFSSKKCCNYEAEKICVFAQENLLIDQIGESDVWHKFGESSQSKLFMSERRVKNDREVYKNSFPQNGISRKIIPIGKNLIHELNCGTFQNCEPRYL
ncbi:hypothetical protein POVCU1_065800 [Plasmodium ovale curtisi]|uniref:Uncharacterized protein n=1 Tax=Plasmodium ovale curtisi TaxID=864141 RepID=A0A1A8X7R3_PLAOA|nr:hypothetical protein POVCU1_065800 [Plasmodium ovale curtisi]